MPWDGWDSGGGADEAGGAGLGAGCGAGVLGAGCEAPPAPVVALEPWAGGPEAAGVE